MVIDPSSRILCAREVQKSLSQSVKRLIEAKIESLEVGHLFDVQQSCIKSAIGTGIVIFSGLADHTADSIKSMEGVDVCWCEEAQSISQRSLDLLRPTIRKEGSELWFTFNPRLETDAIDRLLRGPSPPPDAVVVRVNYEDNPWMPQIMLDEMEYDKSRDIDKFRHVWEGAYLTNSEKRIYKNWKVEDFDTPKDAMFYFGMDLGFSVDPTTIIRCFIEGKKLYIDYEASEIGCETVDLPHLMMQIPDIENWPITIDSSRPETISHLRRNGFPKCRGSVKGANSVVEGIEFLRGYDIIVHPRCKGVTDGLTFYSYKVDQKTDEVTTLIDHASSDFPDAIRYSIELVRRTKKKKVELLPVSGSKNFW